MICRNCSTPHTDGMKFCPQCGVSQNAQSAAARSASGLRPSPTGRASSGGPWRSLLDERWCLSYSVQFAKESDGFFKKAPRQDLSSRSIEESLAMLRDVGSTDSNLLITAEDRQGDTASLLVVIDEDRLFCLSFSMNEDVSFVNSIDEAKVLEFFGTLKSKGPRVTYRELPKPPWEEG